MCISKEQVTDQTGSQRSPPLPVDKENHDGGDFCRVLGEYGANALLRTGSFVWQHGPSDKIHIRPFPDETTAYGARLCSSEVSKLGCLQRIIAERLPYIRNGLYPRKGGKIDVDYLAKYDRARLEYRNLILNIILGAVKAQLTTDNAAAVGMVIRKTEAFELADRIVTPHDSYTIFDEDLNTPAMSLYLISETAAKRLGFPVAAHCEAFRAEVALQMKLNNKLLFQGMQFDGVAARLTFARVSSVSDHLVPHKTDFSSTMYSLPNQRNGFVADMVNLLSNHTDHSRVYTFSMKTRKWRPQQGTRGGFYYY